MIESAAEKGKVREVEAHASSLRINSVTANIGKFWKKMSEDQQKQLRFSKYIAQSIMKAYYNDPNEKFGGK